MAVGSVKFTSTQGAGTADGNTVVSAGPCVVKQIVMSVGATARWYKFYDKALAPTAADTPILRVWVPAGSTVNLDFDIGLAVNQGFGHRSSVAGADNDTTYTSFAAADSCVTVATQALS